MNRFSGALLTVLPNDSMEVEWNNIKRTIEQASYEA